MHKKCKLMFKQVTGGVQKHICEKLCNYYAENQLRGHGNCFVIIFSLFFLEFIIVKLGYCQLTTWSYDYCHS